jgi:hypothetical protein
MWEAVQQDFQQLIASRIYKCLLKNEDHEKFLRRAGFRGRLPSNLNGSSGDHRAALQEAAGFQVHLLISDLKQADSLRERRAKAIELTAPLKLYRLWDSSSQRSRYGFWWFSEGLWEMSAAAGSSIAARAAWLRDHLAVSLDWSRCDRVALMTLQYDDALPAIQALGLEMRVYSRDAWRNPSVPMPEYWRNLDQTFRGGKSQLYIPWVPQRRVNDVA